MSDIVQLHKSVTPHSHRSDCRQGARGDTKKYQKVFIEEVITRTTALRVNDRETHQCDTGRQVGLPGNLDPTCVELCMCVG